MTYNHDNIFAKILRGEIPSKVVYEDDYVLAIHDAFPQAEVHVLILPRGAYISMTDFSEKAKDEEILAMNHAVSKVVEKLNLKEKGYRLIANSGEHGGQEIDHLHWHIVGGEILPKMISKD